MKYYANLGPAKIVITNFRARVEQNILLVLFPIILVWLIFKMKDELTS